MKYLDLLLKIEVYDQPGNAENRCRPSKQIRFKASMLRSDLCDFSDAYIIVKEPITLEGGSNDSRKNRHLAFKNNAPFIGSISKINNTLMLQFLCTIWLNIAKII